MIEKQVTIKVWKHIEIYSVTKFDKAEPFKQAFEDHVKDTFEDELADTVIRILDLCGARGINLEKHINLKLKYNRTRERMHGKNY